MNYRHGYHAGNHADVLKHVVLLGLIDAMARKDSAMFVLDTHAGRGRYRLDSEQAGKTREAEGGVERLLQAFSHGGPPAIARYVQAIRRDNPDGRLQVYPGSPALAAHALRPQDRLACCELQSDEAGALRALFSGDPRVGVHLRDGYQAMTALLPPKERRGLVLIDPPYEAQLDEFDHALGALRRGLERWPSGVFALWYPIKLRRALQRFQRQAAALPARQALMIELLVRPADSPLRMNGSGMLLLNPPWQYEREVEVALPALVDALQEQDGSGRLEWLKREG